MTRWPSSEPGAPNHEVIRSLVPRCQRVFLPAGLLLVWLAVAGVGVSYFGKISGVSSNNQTSYLPESADATQVRALLGGFRDSSGVPEIVVFISNEAITDVQSAELGKALGEAVRIDVVNTETSPIIPSRDGLAAQVFLLIGADEAIGDVVESFDEVLSSALLAGVNAFATGPAGFIADLLTAFSGIDGLLLGVALLAVLIILVLVYRSFLAVLSTGIFALCAALLTVWWLAEWEIPLLSGQTQGILFILVIGAATDYSILIVARFREGLWVNDDTWRVSVAADKGSIRPILSSGGTVIAGLMCLLLRDLQSNRTLGPVASIGIVFATLAGLTLLPAVLFAFGRGAFWLHRPRYEPEVVRAENGLPTKGLWFRLARIIQRRPRFIWMLTTMVLLVGALGLTQLNASGVSQSQLVLGQSGARDGQIALGEHFFGGSGSPVQIVVDEGEKEAVIGVLFARDGIDSVSVIAAGSPSGSVVIPEDSSLYDTSVTAIDGMVLLQGTLKYAPDSEFAVQTVRDLWVAFADITPSALVGGVTATALNTEEASIHDRTLIIPVVLVVITLILMLLRSIVAPVILVVTTVVSFCTALGVAALVFNSVFKFPGADPAVLLFSFVFLVALGIDYSISLMTRVREESLEHGTSQEVVRRLAVTGSVITSSGLVLAATFAALAVLPILFLAQLAFIVVFGVLLDTFVVRTLLVPALSCDIGSRIWWPSKLS